jgi:hypothetical protein
VSKLRELKQLRDQNWRLKQVVADWMLDKDMRHEAVERKWSESGRAPNLFNRVREPCSLSERRSCRAVGAVRRSAMSASGAEIKPYGRE